MKVPNKDQQALVEKLDQMGLASSVMRDFTGILPFIFNEQWHTSISLRKVMYMDKSFTRKELKRLSNALSNIYHNTELLKRREKRKLYFRYWQPRHISHWAYTLNWEYLSTIMPNPEIEEYNKLKAQQIFEESLE